jgi:NAD-dependent protein deacetylase/lipoamidase
MNPKLKQALFQIREKPVVFMTGAGMSAESNIPTFRGEEGYWTVGSTNYRPEAMGTREAFSRMPDDVWCWYLYRRTVCNQAQPNPGHILLARLEQHLGKRFLLVTQNVDGLHLRAGNSLERTYQVHGNTNYMRCWEDCCFSQFLIPEEVGDMKRGDSLSEQQKALLVCPECGGRARPHVLWFDECYDEERFFFQSSLQAALRCGALVSIGSSGSTNLPTQMVRGAAARGAVSIDINPERGPYARLAETSGGFWLKGTAGDGLKLVAQGLGLEP